MVVVVMAAMLTGCGGSNSSDYSDSVSNMSGFNSVGFGDYGYNDSYDVGSSKSESGSASESESVDSSRKIIERYYISTYTKNFDKLLPEVEARVATYGGYIESSNISSDMDGYNRSADFVVRIPTAKSDEFVNFVSENSIVTDKELSTEDVTLEYVDIESRLSALNIEKESLERLLAEAVSVDDIITIQRELTDVIYDIESAQSRLRTYNNLIDYTTISLYIYEAEETEVVEELSMWEEIATRFKGNLIKLGDEITDLIIFIISESPYIVIYCLVGFGIYVAVKKANKKKAAKANDAVITVEQNTEKESKQS